MLSPFPFPFRKGQPAGSLMQAGTQKGHQECPSALSGQKGPGRVTLNEKGLCGRMGLAGGWTSKATAALGNPWHGTCRGPMATDLCAGKVRVQFLPLPQGTQSSCPASQESSLANEQNWFGWGCSLSILSEPCHSAERNSWSQRKDTSELGHTGVRAGWWEGLSVLLLYLCEIKSPVPSAEPLFFFLPVVWSSVSLARERCDH